jgi:uncharacterized protein (TIGR03435 family)
MNSEHALKELIDRHVPSPSHMEIVASRERVLEQLRSMPAQRQQARITIPEPTVSRWRPFIATATAAAVVVVVVGAAITWPRGARLYATGSEGLQFTLADDSGVEMRAHSELAVDRAADGLRIQLKKGGIIVNAARQHNGHLYVQTKDMTVAVVGTVFVVNAAEDGSRVAVIEGEVRVREGNTETRLRPGEQVSTNPAMAVRPVKEEIAWSRNADAHLAILTAFANGMAATSGPRRPLTDGSTAQGQPAPRFEEASIRPCDPDNLPPTPPGARGGGANSFQMTPGRVHALCMTLATLIRTAYGYGAVGMEFMNGGSRRPAPIPFDRVAGLGVEDGRRVRGGPDWIRSERYSIDAIGDASASPLTLSQTMLQDLIERRFQLKVHIETEQVPAFAMTVAKGGLKMKQVSADGVEASGFVRAGVINEGCDAAPEPLPGQGPIPRSRTAEEVRRGAKPTCGIFAQTNGPNMVYVGGGARLGGEGLTGLTRLLGLRLGEVQVLDKTGLTGAYNFILEVSRDENAEPSAIPRAPGLFVALEEQLGLKLDPARVPREFIVIDQVERPAAN